MSSSSVSFRISRHTQDLAETVHALSQRLVAMEQRLLLLEEQLQAVRQQPLAQEAADAASLAPVEASIERLLQDCRQLLADQPIGESSLAMVPPAGVDPLLPSADPDATATCPDPGREPDAGDHSDAGADSDCVADLAAMVSPGAEMPDADGSAVQAA